MYFYLPQALVVWIGSIWLIQWHRWRELLVFGLFGGFMCLFQDHLGHLTGYWTYTDGGPLNTHDEISLLISISAAPTFGLFFAQGLRPGSPFPWQRILAISAVAMIPEVVGVQTGNLIYGGWWNVWASIAAHLILWSLFSQLHRVLTASQKA